MTALDSRSIIIGLPTISIHFHSSMAVVQWIPLAYQLTIIGFVLSLARLEYSRSQEDSRLRISATGVGLCVFRPEHWIVANHCLQSPGGFRCGDVFGQWKGDSLDGLCTKGERPSAWTRVDGLPFRLYQRSFGCGSSHRYAGLALDLFSEPAGGARGSFHGLEGFAGNCDPT